jgi:hypothetical protein
MATHQRLEYMPFVTNNAKSLVATTMVACVYCRTTYEASKLGSVHNCLLCRHCGIDAVMIVKDSPLHGLSKEEQDLLLEKWYKAGFT